MRAGRALPCSRQAPLLFARSASRLHLRLADNFEKGTTYVSFEADRVAEPSLECPTVVMLDGLPAKHAALYSSPACIVKPVEEWPDDMAELERRYCRVLGQRREWVRYSHRLEVRLSWQLVPLEERELPMGIAAVLNCF